MNDTEIIESIREIIISVIEHENFEMNNELIASDVDGWDSLSQLMIISEIEKRFEIKFKLNEVYDIENLGDLIKLTQSKII